ncbi:D-alanyl-D-alanine carboxypeptidase family protein [Candidatus Saccharibacteria bacterium]|nr:D-alanyl-D-alanine carboxypeptidase family protein [Candidatus Saccharibacteria bacterium]
MKKNKKLIILICIFTFILSGILAFFIQKSTNNSSDFGENSDQKITDEKDDLDKNQTTETESLGETQPSETETLVQSPAIDSDNCTTSLGSLMLINPNFTVDDNFIATRKSQLINITDAYGIREGNHWNGVPLLDPEAAIHLNDMLNDYKSAYVGHEITTRSCFRSVGTNCGRLCYATGTSDHHTGYTCDLIDDYYGGSLDTDLADSHPEWAWLHANSYKYGFIDRFVESWAGGSMSEPVNVDANGTTGLYETWHYRYVGIAAATEIALGKYNNGNYDSLEHYLKATGRVGNLLDKTSCN